MLVAIIANNLPEAIASAFDLRRITKPLKQIAITWISVSVICFIFVILGYSVFANFSPSVTATLEAAAAGAILAMLASTMMPEAFKESGIDASVATVMGFILIFILSKIGV